MRADAPHIKFQHIQSAYGQTLVANKTGTSLILPLADVSDGRALRVLGAHHLYFEQAVA